LKDRLLVSMATAPKAKAEAFMPDGFSVSLKAEGLSASRQARTGVGCQDT
jgi:hypothetical protein